MDNNKTYTTAERKALASDYIAEYDSALTLDEAIELESALEQTLDADFCSDTDFSRYYKRECLDAIKCHWGNNDVDHEYSNVVADKLRGLGGLWDVDSHSWAFRTPELASRAQDICDSIYWDERKRKYRSA